MIKENILTINLELISHFNYPRLRNEDLERDLFGAAYEYLLEEFADVTKKGAG